MLIFSFHKMSCLLQWVLVSVLFFVVLYRVFNPRDMYVFAVLTEYSSDA